MIAFRAPSSARDKGTLMPAATFDACKLLISNKKLNRQETKKKGENSNRSNRNKISN
jgi:hypothetical protein